MANHAYVKTKLKMSPEEITCLVQQLNDNIFHNCLKIEYGEGGWGEYTWEVTVLNEDGKECGHKIFWLNSPNSFEMRHSGGNFIWWIDTIITNEIALKFKGIITDDGHGDKVKPERKYNKFRRFNKMMSAHLWSRKSQKEKWNPKTQIPIFWATMQSYEANIPEVFKCKNWRFKAEFVSKGVKLTPTGKH